MSDLSLNKIICAFENCNKKLKLTDYSCKCGFVYCKFHINPLHHKCEYDYKENIDKQKKINTMKCNSCKLEKI